MEANTLLQVQDLHVHFPLREGVVKAVEGVDFEIKLGSTIGLWGFPTRNTPVPPPRPPFVLDLVAPDRLIVTAGPGKGSIVDMIRKTDGSIGWMRMGLRVFQRQ